MLTNAKTVYILMETWYKFIDISFIRIWTETLLYMNYSLCRTVKKK